MKDLKSNARDLRRKQTRSEGLLWSLLRGGQLCGMRFRRQQPIAPWIVDFACLAGRLVVEIDGDYHDATQPADLRRQIDLENRGWTVLRFSADDVEKDAESIARAIAAALGVEYSFTPRRKTGSDMRSAKAKRPHAGRPSPRCRSTLPGGG